MRRSRNVLVVSMMPMIVAFLPWPLHFYSNILTTCFPESDPPYGDPGEVIRGVHNARRHYAFDTLTTTFNFGGIAHSEITQSMRLFAKEVMPAFA